MLSHTTGTGSTYHICSIYFHNFSSYYFSYQSTSGDYFVSCHVMITVARHIFIMITSMIVATSTVSSTTIVMSIIRRLSHIYFKKWTSTNWSELMIFNNNLLFCSASKRHIISSTYLLNLFSQYWCCRSTFET